MQASEQVPALANPVIALPPQRNWLQWIFLGPNGVRALWRLVMFVVIVFGLRFGIHKVFQLLHLSRQNAALTDFSAKTVLLQDGLAFSCVLVASLAMAGLEKRSFGDYGLPLRGAFGKRFIEGIVWGFVAECATMYTLYLTGNVQFHGYDATGSAAVRLGLMWALAFLMVGFFEEFLFRGYPQFTLATGIGFWPTAFLISGLFGFAHLSNSGETWVGGVSVVLAGLLFCVTLKLTGNLWFAVGMHASWDWAETFFFGVADSGMPANGHLLNTTMSGSTWMTGGTVGPEGSVVELIVVSAVIGLLFLRFGREKPRLTAPLS